MKDRQSLKERIKDGWYRVLRAQMQGDPQRADLERTRVEQLARVWLATCRARRALQNSGLVPR